MRLRSIPTLFSALCKSKIKQENPKFGFESDLEASGMAKKVEDLDAETMEKIAEELLRGKDSAVQLQTLLMNGGDLHRPRAGSSKPPPGELARRILRSFTRALSELTESPTQIFEEKKKKKGSRRGCYKRRRSSNSWVIESSTKEDGHAWRKYGQKEILNSQYPRCYYRCTHKSDGCKAMKQVQAIREEPILYQTTYFHYHTCSQIMAAASTSHLDVLYASSPDPAESSNLISFRRKKCDLVGNARMDQVKSENVSEEALSDGMSSLQDALWDELAPGSQPSNDPDEGDFGNMFWFYGDAQMIE